MEEINVNQEMEKVMEEVAVPNYGMLEAFGLGVVASVAAYGLYKGCKALAKHLNNKSKKDDQTDVIETEVTETYEDEDISED